MRDRIFLVWLHQRLLTIHKEPHEADYMGKLRSIIKAMDPEQVTANTSPSIDAREEAKRVEG